MWDSYHLIGDIMRGDPVLRADFAQRLRQRMDGEATVLAPRARWRSANHFAYSAAAAVAGVAVVLAVVWANNPLRPQAEQLAAATAAAKHAAPATAGQRVQPANQATQAQVNEYLMAHQEFSPRTALQGVAPYVRSVSESHDGNRR